MSSCLTLKKSNCKNCYKCIRHCPVKSIRFSGNQAHIIEDECILCGQCFVVCPQDAKQIVDEIEKVKVLLQMNEKVIVSLAPSFIANYRGVGIESMREAIKQLGFYDVEETAIGATIVKNEYNKIIKKQEQDILITSCCHSINLLIQKYFPNQLQYLANVMSPMQAHCVDIKKRYPDAKTVFIGPCVSKKDEAQKYPGIVDAVLTFEDLSKLLFEKGIELKKQIINDDKTHARLFPTAGGVLKTLTNENGKYKYLALDGIENCINALQEIESGLVHSCIIEMSACTGSCISGPVMSKHKASTLKNFLAVENYAGKKDFEVNELESKEIFKYFPEINNNVHKPTEEEIKKVLKQMGKYSTNMELNCGSCGYDTCRKKAEAVCLGKAEISMCLPFLKDKAENFSDNIFSNTPNGLLVVNEKLEIQQINPAALKIINLKNASDVLGDQVNTVLDSKLFEEVLRTRRNIRDRKVYIAEYEKYVEESVIYDDEYNILLCLLRDVTSEEVDKKKKEEMSEKTAEIADKVVEKQMRIVQEIASLLGETAAETKIALTKLKESIKDE